MASEAANKSGLAKELGVSRSSLYYHRKQPDKDWELKCEIEKVLREHPAYGHKRLAIQLRINKKRILRVMKIFGIKPYRKRGKNGVNRGKKRVWCFPICSLQLSRLSRTIFGPRTSRTSNSGANGFMWQRSLISVQGKSSVSAFC